MSTRMRRRRSRASDRPMMVQCILASPVGPLLLAAEARALVGTEFQKAVCRSLAAIPFGETRTYLQCAREIGRPTAVRAVGAANGSNPIAIVIPCHRVIGANGSLTGFGGGLDVKRWLLDL